MPQYENKKCPICKITLNKTYILDDIQKRTKNKNNGYTICKPQSICECCNSLEVLARLDRELVAVAGLNGFSFIKPKDWWLVSVTRRKNIGDWAQLIAVEMLNGKSYSEALNSVRENTEIQ